MHQSIGIYFGSTTGNTEMAAQKIQAQLGDKVVARDITSVRPADFLAHDILLLGVSTWNIGQMQDDWDRLLPQMAGLDLTGKKIGLFGMGDSFGYPHNFLDAMGQLWQVLKELGQPQLVGVWPLDGYDFEDSEALFDDEHFVGLGLDEDNDPGLHDERITAWLSKVLVECGLPEAAKDEATAPAGWRSV